MYAFLSRHHAAALGDGRRQCHRLLCCVFVAIFILYALNYAYFFVDDEAIPFVYAQNVLDGYGLVYNPADGPVEGYSDFLSVWIDVGILALVHAVGAGKLSALACAQLLAFACAVALVVFTFSLLRRRLRVTAVPLAAGMMFLAVAGPLAVWSWSGLETTLFALLTAVLSGALLDAERADARNDRLILLTVAAMLLCRIDGFVWAGALVAPFLVFAAPARRRQLAARVVLPAIAVFVGYNAWRVWYFGEILPMPLYSKVLYKIGPHETLVSYDPPERYVLAFLRSYRWIPVAALSLGFAGAYYRSRAVRLLALAVGLIAAYLSVVGDWMFGFRFFVPLLAPVAVIAAAVFSDLRVRWPRAAFAAAIIWSAALCGVAYEFLHAYERTQHRQSWLMHPTLDPARFFAPYYQIYLDARPYVGPGETMAYNQAGFVPFMLSARNVDDLGICTKFYAKLPTTDVVFTEAGRYTPLTPRPVLPAAQTYTLSRAPRLLLAPADNLRYANRGTIPRTVLGGAYRLLFRNASVAGYIPVGPVEAVRDRRRYLENLAHVSHLRRVSINGQSMAASEYRPTLRYLYGRLARLRFEGRYTADLSFSDSVEDVYELYVSGLRGAEAATVEVTLKDDRGAQVYRNSFDVRADRPRDVHVMFDGGLKAAALSIEIAPRGPGPHTFYLEDVRVQGQTEALKRFLDESL